MSVPRLLAFLPKRVRVVHVSAVTVELSRCARRARRRRHRDVIFLPDVTDEGVPTLKVTRPDAPRDARDTRSETHSESRLIHTAGTRGLAASATAHVCDAAPPTCQAHCPPPFSK
eukprot:6179102-Pleurochrysis_carterae.AAC.4